MNKNPGVTSFGSPGQLKQSRDGSLDGLQRTLLHFLSPRSASGTTDSRGQASVGLSTKTAHVPQQSGACWRFTTLLRHCERRAKLYPRLLPPSVMCISVPSISDNWMQKQVLSHLRRNGSDKDLKRTKKKC